MYHRRERTTTARRTEGGTTEDSHVDFLNLIVDAKHTASIIIPVDKLPRPTCGMRRRMQTFFHLWNSTKTHAMSNPDPPSFPIFIIPKTYFLRKNNIDGEAIA